MKKLRTTALVASVCLFAGGTLHAAELSVGGQVPLIAEVMGMGFTSLDLSVAATDAVVAQVIVSCNAPTFDVVFTAENGTDAGTAPVFNQMGSGTGTLDITAMDGAAEGSGTLGTGGVAPAVDLADAAGTLSTDTWSVTQTTATSDYVIDMTATWAEDETLLAGFYKETITVTISPEL